MTPPTQPIRESLDDPRIADRVRAGDPATLKAVVDGYLPQVLRAARGAGLGPEEADEVTQETFIAFLEAATRFEGRSRVRTFLFGILYRKVAEARRSRARDRRHDPIDDVVESRFTPKGSWSRPPEPTDRKLESGEIRRALASCLEASPTPQRLAFYLREVEGLSTDEICKILDVSPNNLGVMLYRLRNRTRECLETKRIGGAS